MTRKFAVLGKPIAHSKSPVIHNAAFKKLNADASYGAIELGSGLEGFLSDHQDFDGFSVTMPLKDEAFRVSSRLDEMARATSSVNTLFKESGHWCGYNTDVYGIQRAISGVSLENTMVLGTGATARSAVVALLNLGATPKIWGRNPDRVAELAERYQIAAEFEISKCSESSLVISTLPALALDDHLAGIPEPSGTLLDVAYSPWPSKAAIHWGESGHAISGLEMLIWQAIAQQRIFAGNKLEEQLSGEDAVVEAVRAALSVAQ